MKKLLFSITFSIFTCLLIAQSIEATNNLIHSKEVYFDFALYDIRPDADSTLQEIAAFILAQKEEELLIKITAHTDWVGTNKNNQILSQNRATAVKDYLVEKGIAKERMEASVFGEERPAATNETDDGRQKNRRATIDIFTTQKMIWMEGTVVSAEKGIGIESDVIIRTKEKQDTLVTNKDGQFKALVPLDAIVGLDVFSKCYFLNTQMLKATPDKLTNLKIELKSAKVGEMTDIDNLYYVGNEAIVLDKSEPELPKILKFMELNDCIKIEIAGHVNVPRNPPVTKHSWEYGLSVRRAKTVFEYLLKHGIAEDRLSYQGYGNWEMRFPKAVAEVEQAQNRRVEIRVIESGDCLCDKEKN